MRARAILEGWIVPTEDREKLVQVLIERALESQSDRERIRAVEALLSISNKEIDIERLITERKKLKQEKPSADDPGKKRINLPRIDRRRGGDPQADEGN
jgi:hypothetical protein